MRLTPSSPPTMHVRSHILDMLWYAAALLSAALAVILAYRIAHHADLRACRRAMRDTGEMPHPWAIVARANHDARRHWWGRAVVPAGWSAIQPPAFDRPPFTTQTGRVIH